jgi:hypothetical protein
VAVFGERAIAMIVPGATAAVVRVRQFSRRRNLAEGLAQRTD